MGFIVEKTGSYNLVFQLTTGDNLFSICHRLGPRMLGLASYLVIR